MIRRRAKKTVLAIAVVILVSVVSIVVDNVRLGVSNSFSRSLGVYVGNYNPRISSIDAELGNPIGSVMTFANGATWTSIVAGAPTQCRIAQIAKVRLIAPYNMLPNHGGSLALGAKGNYDSEAYDFGLGLVRNGCANAIVRIGWEFNGDWFPWKARGKKAAFTAYWRQIVESMRMVPGQHLKFLWNPTVAHSKYFSLTGAYPGDNYVNVIGLDVYDMSEGVFPGGQRNWNDIIDATYGLDWLANFGAAHHKLLAIPEWGLGWGSHGGGDDSYFVTKMVQWISTHNVLFATVWDYGNDPVLSSGAPKATAALIAACST